MRGCALVLVAVALLFAQPRPAQRKKAPPKVEAYDPDKLPAGEVPCGRPDKARNAPCRCMEHRRKITEERRQECQRIDDRQKRFACYAEIPHCPPVADAENRETGPDGELMPAQCSRSCRLAKCLCCHS